MRREVHRHGLAQTELIFRIRKREADFIDEECAQILCLHGLRREFRFRGDVAIGVSNSSSRPSFNAASIMVSEVRQRCPMLTTCFTLSGTYRSSSGVTARPMPSTGSAPG